MEVWLWMVTATIGTANAVVMDNHTTIIIFVIKFPSSLVQRSKLGSLLPSYDAKPYQHMVELFCKVLSKFYLFL